MANYQVRRDSSFQRFYYILVRHFRHFRPGFFGSRGGGGGQNNIIQFKQTFGNFRLKLKNIQSRAFYNFIFQRFHQSQFVYYLPREVLTRYAVDFMSANFSLFIMCLVCSVRGRWMDTKSASFKTSSRLDLNSTEPLGNSFSKSSFLFMS